ncbi:hypothetical protein [Halomonas sp. BM-2019]|uniref:hypothetical protein n=1 Tax=Halomonas sp. BM-2019 TaxID=2811227 RepID=UPI001B3C2F8C|nr:MAG: hypothetical protein J5F18_07545 [Halomonas sp. BM-2019]
MKFISLPLHYFSKLKSPNDFHNYVDGLAIIDDLLCKFDTEPRSPMYHPKDNQGRPAGDPVLLKARMSECLDELESPYIKDNLAQNFERAMNLYSESMSSSDQIQLFLSDLLYHYADIINPEVYPGNQGLIF